MAASPGGELMAAGGAKGNHSGFCRYYVATDRTEPVMPPEVKNCVVAHLVSPALACSICTSGAIRVE